MDKRTFYGVLCALLAAAGYAFFPIFTKLLYQYSSFGALDIAGWRFMIAVPLIWGVVVVRARFSTEGAQAMQDRLPRVRLMILGFMLSTGALAAFYGLSLIETGMYVILFRTYPVMVLIFSAMLGEALPPRAWLVLVLVLAGVSLMVLDPSQVDVTFNTARWVGVGVAFYNAFVIAWYNIGQQRVIRGHSAKIRASAWTLTGALFTLVPLMLWKGLQPIPNWQTFGAELGLALVSTVIPLIAIYEGISRLGASRFVLIGSVEPMLALLLAWLLFGEILTPIQLLGGGLILLSVVMLELPISWLRLRLRKRLAPAIGD